jgi:hypothetical protein
VTTDLDGTIRPKGGAFDIGAYEHAVSSPSSPSNVHIQYVQ